MKWILVLLLIPGFLLGEITWRETMPGGFSASVTISKEKITVLEPLSIDLALTYPSGYRVDQDKLKEHLLRHNPWQPPSFKLISSENIGQTIQYRLQPQLSGTHVLSFFNISFFPEDNTKETVTIISDLFEIDVIGVPLLDPSTIVVGPLLRLSPNFPITLSDKNRHLLMGVESQKAAEKYNLDIFRQAAFPWWIPLSILALILITWAVKESAQKKKLKPEEQAKRIEEIALASLQDLEKQHLPQQKQFMPFYIKLTDTARNFIEKKYQLHAPKLTTQEFLQKAAEFPAFDEEMKKRLEKFLLSADRVKFAQHHPTFEECSQALEDAKKLIVS